MHRRGDRRADSGGSADRRGARRGAARASVARLLVLPAAVEIRRGVAAARARPVDRQGRGEDHVRALPAAVAAGREGRAAVGSRHHDGERRCHHGGSAAGVPRSPCIHRAGAVHARQRARRLPAPAADHGAVHRAGAARAGGRGAVEAREWKARRAAAGRAGERRERRSGGRDTAGAYGRVRRVRSAVHREQACPGGDAGDAGGRRGPLALECATLSARVAGGRLPAAGKVHRHVRHPRSGRGRRAARDDPRHRAEGADAASGDADAHAAPRRGSRAHRGVDASRGDRERAARAVRGADPGGACGARGRGRCAAAAGQRRRRRRRRWRRVARGHGQRLGVRRNRRRTRDDAAEAGRFAREPGDRHSAEGAGFLRRRDREPHPRPFAAGP